MEHINLLVEVNILVNGSKVIKKALVVRHSLMGNFMKDITKIASFMVMENINLMMVGFILVNGLTVI